MRTKQPNQHPDREELDLASLMPMVAHELAIGLMALVGDAEYAEHLLKTLHDAKESSNGVTERLGTQLARIRFGARCQMFEMEKILMALNPEHGRILITRTTHAAPDALLEEMLPAYTRSAEPRGIELQFEPSSDPMPKINLDLMWIKRTFHNVLSNAVKYSYRSQTGSIGHTVRFVHIRCRRHDPQGNHWVLRFQNYGIPVEADEVAAVFRRGYRGRRAIAEGINGMGLGLYDVQACMERHGGKAALECKHLPEGVGLTTVSLIFPSRSHLT